MTKPDPISPCPRCGSTCYVCRGGGMLGGAGVMLCKGDKAEAGCPCYYQAHNLEFHEYICVWKRVHDQVMHDIEAGNFPKYRVNIYKAIRAGEGE